MDSGHFDDTKVVTISQYPPSHQVGHWSGLITKRGGQCHSLNIEQICKFSLCLHRGEGNGCGGDVTKFIKDQN